MNQLAPEQLAHPAAVAQEFMKRSDMKGGEVEVYAQTFNWLAGFLEGGLVALTSEEHTALLDELKELRELRREHDEGYEMGGEIPVLKPEGPADELEDVDSETK